MSIVEICRNKSICNSNNNNNNNNKVIKLLIYIKKLIIHDKTLTNIAYV